VGHSMVLIARPTEVTGPICRGCPTKNNMVPIQFPPNIAEMLDDWESDPDENVGWCLLTIVRRGLSWNSV
jgi:hypothetical protein